MPSARILNGDLGQFLIFVLFNDISHRIPNYLIGPDTAFVQLLHSPHAHPLANDYIYAGSTQNTYRLAHAMGVMSVGVIDGAHRLLRGIINGKMLRAAKMSVDLGIQSILILCWYA
jgi:hypothetical protein